MKDTIGILVINSRTGNLIHVIHQELLQKHLKCLFMDFGKMQ